MLNNVKRKLTTFVTKDISKKIDIKQKLNDNYGYCPCSLVKSPDTKCMCLEFREQQEEGPCHCGLYYKEYV